MNNKFDIQNIDWLYAILKNQKQMLYKRNRNKIFHISKIKMKLTIKNILKKTKKVSEPLE